MTVAAPVPLSWNFDNVDISHFCKKSDSPADTNKHMTTLEALDIIFGELKGEADRPIRDRLNEALRQWHLRRYPQRK